MEAVVLTREAHDGYVELAHVLEIYHAEATVDLRGISQRVRLLREERLAARDVEATALSRDEPLESSERCLLIRLSAVGKRQSSAFDSPKPGVMKMTPVLGG